MKKVTLFLSFLTLLEPTLCASFPPAKETTLWCSPRSLHSAVLQLVSGQLGSPNLLIFYGAGAQNLRFVHAKQVLYPK